jgi:hypothetical protein
MSPWLAIGVDALWNLGVLALAWAAYGGLGVLLFRKSLAAESPWVRSHLYVLLGWAAWVVVAYALRMVPLPFSVSGPWCLALIAAALGMANRDLIPLRPLRPTLLPLILLAVCLAGFLPYGMGRILTPGLRDVGSWGYDQRNYVLTTSGLLDEGLLAESTPPLARTHLPYLEYVRDSIHQLVTADDGLPDWHYRDLQERLGLAPSASRDYALFPRRGFSAQDALMASLLRLDPQQAYSLSVWMQHLLLVHIGLLWASLLNLSSRSTLLAVILVAYWPYSSLSMSVDNRDQANSLVLVFLLVALLRHLPSHTATSTTCLLALLAGYPELFPLYAALWVCLRRDTVAGWGESLRQSARDWGRALLIFSPLLLPQILGLARQWHPSRIKDPLDFPPTYDFQWSFLDYPVGWGLLWNPWGPAEPLKLLATLLLLTAAAWGFWRECQAGRTGLMWALGAMLAAGYLFFFREQFYVAYKVSTVFWPVVVWAVLSVWAARPSPAPGAARLRTILLAGIILVSIPAVWIKSGASFPGQYLYFGTNKHLRADAPLSITAIRKEGELIRLGELRDQVVKTREQVLFLGMFNHKSVDDIGFAQMLFRKHGGFIVPAPGESGLSAHPQFIPLPAGQKLHRILFLNNIDSTRRHLPGSHLVLGRPGTFSWQTFHFTSTLRVHPAEPVILITPLAKGDFPAQLRSHPDQLLPLPLDQTPLFLRVILVNHDPRQTVPMEFIFQAPISPPLSGAVSSTYLDVTQTNAIPPSGTLRIGFSLSATNPLHLLKFEGPSGVVLQDVIPSNRPAEPLGE